jgi:hypothetical protein
VRKRQAKIEEEIRDRSNREEKEKKKREEIVIKHAANILFSLFPECKKSKSISTEPGTNDRIRFNEDGTLTVSKYIMNGEDHPYIIQNLEKPPNTSPFCLIRERTIYKSGFENYTELLAKIQEMFTEAIEINKLNLNDHEFSTSVQIHPATDEQPYDISIVTENDNFVWGTSNIMFYKKHTPKFHGWINITFPATELDKKTSNNPTRKERKT